MERLHIPDYQADVDTALAQGNIGKAEKIATSQAYAKLWADALYMLKHSNQMELCDLVDTIKELTREKQDINDYLDLFLVWFRDILLFKATKEVDTLVFKQELNYIKERARSSSYEGLEKILEATETAKNRLQANVNFELAMELLFLTIREN
jgi:DNA polymerase-3 subunit delta'